MEHVRFRYFVFYVILVLPYDYCTHMCILTNIQVLLTINWIYRFINNKNNNVYAYVDLSACLCCNCNSVNNLSAEYQLLFHDIQCFECGVASCCGNQTKSRSRFIRNIAIHVLPANRHTHTVIYHDIWYNSILIGLSTTIHQWYSGRSNNFLISYHILMKTVALALAHFHPCM